VIAADEVAAEGLARARTLKMTSVDQTHTRNPPDLRTGKGEQSLVALCGR
jgi:hypothetical protein